MALAAAGGASGTTHGAVVQSSYFAGGVGLYLTDSTTHPGLGSDGLGVVPVRVVAPTSFRELGVLVHDQRSGHVGFGVCIELASATCEPAICPQETVSCLPLAIENADLVPSSTLPQGTVIDVFVYAVADDENHLPAYATTGVVTLTFVS